MKARPSQVSLRALQVEVELARQDATSRQVAEALGEWRPYVRQAFARMASRGLVRPVGTHARGTGAEATIWTYSDPQHDQELP